MTPRRSPYALSPPAPPPIIAAIVIAKVVVLNGRWCAQDVTWFLGDVGGAGGGGGGPPLSLPRPRSPSNSTSLLMWHCCRHTGRRSMHTHPCTPLPPTLPAHRSHTYTPWYPFSRLAATRNTSSGMCAWSWEGAWGCSAGRMGCTQRLQLRLQSGRGGGVCTQGQAGGIRPSCTPTA